VVLAITLRDFTSGRQAVRMTDRAGGQPNVVTPILDLRVLQGTLGENSAVSFFRGKHGEQVSVFGSWDNLVGDIWLQI
jgi:hypothetical protein